MRVSVLVSVWGQDGTPRHFHVQLDSLTVSDADNSVKESKRTAYCVAKVKDVMLLREVQSFDTVTSKADVLNHHPRGRARVLAGCHYACSV